MTDPTGAPRLAENLGVAFLGDSKGGPFELGPEAARDMLAQTNRHGRPNSDVVVPWLAATSITRRPGEAWIIDFGASRTEEQAARYEAPFAHVREHVLPRRPHVDRWWLHADPRPEMRQALAGLPRFLATVRLAERRIFFWIDAGTLPDGALVVFARDDDVTFGALQSRVHTLWSLAAGAPTRAPDGRPRYTPTLFETFPLPRPGPAQRNAIAAAARSLDALRRGWLRVHRPSGLRRPRTLTQLYTDDPTWLQHAHEALDRAVLAAYGWDEDLSDAELLDRLLTESARRPHAPDDPARTRRARRTT